ncbi:hypothetical protein A2U01_0074729, partial [Trifolium medium]|nr:hypothetical protein [Trifolium medium]
VVPSWGSWVVIPVVVGSRSNGGYSLAEIMG